MCLQLMQMDVFFNLALLFIGVVALFSSEHSSIPFSVRRASAFRVIYSDRHQLYYM